VSAAAVGILGGTFNPPHVAHLVMAQEARDQLGLDRVVLVPAGVPPHKDVRGVDPGPAARLELCRLAVAGDAGLGVSEVELERAGPSFTVDTLRLLHERDPEQELTFIVGGDMAATLPSWREPEAVLSLARLAVAERSGVRRDVLAERLSGLAGADRIAFFEMPRLDVSSSDLRARVATGRPIRHLVPDAVAAVIAQRGYYRARRGSPVA
jgi:nicotinate-nucleotide adenylyltransferase